MLDLILFTVMGGVIGILIIFITDVLIQSRMPSKENMPWQKRFTRLICPNCQKEFSIRGYLISFHCPHCTKRPPAKNFIVMIASIIVSVLVGLFPLGGLSYWATIPVLVFLGMILVIDIEYHAVLLETSILGFILFFCYGLFMQGFLVTIIGGVAGALIMLFIYFFGIFFSKLMAKINKIESPEPGMGLGDVYVCGFLGFFAGWPWIIGSIVIAILLSGIFSFFYLIVKSITRKYQLNLTIPYAPFLIIGAIAVFYLPPL